MKNPFYNTEFTKKSMWLSTAIILGIGTYSFAQPLPALPPLPDAKPAANSMNSSVPPLPALPPLMADSKAAPSIENTKSILPNEDKKESIKITKTAPAISDQKNAEITKSLPVSADTASSTGNIVTPLAPLPDLAPATQVSSDPFLDTSKSLSSGSAIPVPLSAQNSNILAPLADLPSLESLSTDKPKRPKSAAAIDTAKKAADDKGKPPTETSTENNDTVALGIPPLPGMLPLPGAVTDEKDMPVLPAIPGLSANNSGTKKTKVLDEKAKKSWEVVLESPPPPVEISFNYRRVLLPNTIYRVSYNDDNEHLPLAVTRQDYEGLLFASVMKNDVEATRALLNAGTDIRAINNYGQTLLSAAHMVGAQATERLLLARGAR